MDVPAFRAFLPETLVARLWADAEPVPGVPGLRTATGLRAQFPQTETDEALSIVVEVYRAVRGRLGRVLEQRQTDRAFADSITAAAAEGNRHRSYDDPDYATVIGQRDASGRLVVGPLPDGGKGLMVEVPAFLRGEQITLFGPPDTARMCINAMNALHRRRRDEPAIVGDLVEASGQVPRWGADDEDSKTPIMSSFLRACENLVGCFDRSLRFETATKTYTLAETGLALPIKRVPGLALPDGSHLLDGEPLPLHLLDLVLHVWHQRTREQARVLYFPKLENEDEAAYLAELIAVTEAAVKRRHPDYRLGTVRILVVFENPRAIFRIREIAEALHPYFVGGSLGWHDFLASTARLFKNDPRYRIPVKADPNIVINDIRESHRILVEKLAPIGALALGGMYGVLYEEGDERSYDVSLAGFVRDVVTQMKRGLGGFWVAHPDFVRPGIALVEAWRRRERDPADGSLRSLLEAMFAGSEELAPLLRFVDAPDAAGHAPSDPRYARSVLAADHDVSSVIANDHPDEVRYNVFQALQYLADWLSGNGCVALPAMLRNARGEEVAVRIMDDLATTERSRWELWAEVNHGRVSIAAFDAVVADVVAQLREGRDEPRWRIHVQWDDRWTPIAARLLRQLVVDPQPPEFVSELALPFTLPLVRDAADPWEAANALCPGKLHPESRA